MASSTAAWISISDGCADDPPAAKWAPSRSPSRVTAVTSGSCATSLLAAVQVVDDRDLEQQPGQCATQVVGALDRVDGVRRLAGQAGPVAVRRRRSTEQQSGATEVRAAEVADGADRGVGVGDRHGIRGGPEGGGDRGLVAGAHRQQRGHRAEQTGHGVGCGEQRPRAVLAVEPELEGFLAGGEAAAVPVGPGGLLAQLGEAFLDVVEGRRGAFVLGVETLLAGVQAGDPGLQRGEVALRAVGPGQRVLSGQRQPADLVRGGCGAAPQGVDLAVQPGQPLPAVGRGALQAGDPAFLVGGGLLGGLARLDRGLHGTAVALHLGDDLLLLAAHPPGLGLQLFGVATAMLDRVLGRAGSVAHPLARQRPGAVQPLAQTGQGEPGLLGLRQRGQVLAQLRLEPRLGLPGRLGVSLDPLPAFEQDRLVGQLLLQRGGGADEVVGEQPGAGVADVGLYGGRAPGDLGLSPERLELAADLAEQVAQPGQVAVGRVELAERLLLALAVLEDAGGLLDEPTTVLGGRVQDRVELALPDDHVHLPADARVREELLHVEQPAVVSVDRVFRPAVAEHGPADRHLGVLDRERAVGVVDGQQHLGASERGAARRTGEDDVLHLAAAQGLGALLAHHPGQRVDDVGLAGTVGADDAGDARLELQGRRRGERLEPSERQALEVQGFGSPLTEGRSLGNMGVRRGSGSGHTLPAARAGIADPRRPASTTAPAEL